MRWRSRARWIALLAAVPAVLAAGGYAATELRLERRYRVEPAPLTRRPDPEPIARGEHLVRAVAQCPVCHGGDLAGTTMADDFWIGRLDSGNLTPGRGGIGERSDADLVRAIRHGIGADGRPLLVMPSHGFARLGDRDLAAVVAYLRALPPVDRVKRPTRVGPLARLALALGRAPELLPAELVDHERTPVPPPPSAATPAYGEYLVALGGCRVCHRADLAGGLHPLSLPGEPLPPDLTPAGRLASWSEADFVRTLRSGRTPEGRQLDPAFMPWPATAALSDLELRAIWLYLRSLPPQAPHAPQASEGRAQRAARPKAAQRGARPKAAQRGEAERSSNGLAERSSNGLAERSPGGASPRSAPTGARSDRTRATG